MNADCSPAREVQNLPNDNLGAPAEALHDDFALLKLDKMFVALLSEISAVEPNHRGGIGATGDHDAGN
jgi:hypothetical protein